MELRCRAGCEKTASSRSTSERRALGTAGISGANKRNRTPGRRTAPHTPLAMAPATVSTTPASTGRQRGRTARASRIRPMTMSSTPIRIRLWIRIVGVSPGAPSQDGEPRPGSAPSGSAMRSQSHRSLPRRVSSTVRLELPGCWSWAGWQVQVSASGAGRPAMRPTALRIWNSSSAVSQRLSSCAVSCTLPGRVWYFRACMTGRGCCPARAAVPLVATPRCASRAWIGSV